MRQNFLHRLVQEHRTMLEYTTTCCENAHVFFAVSDIPSTIFAYFACFKSQFPWQSTCVGIIVCFEALKQCISCQNINTHFMPSAWSCIGYSTCVKTFCTDLCKSTAPCSSTPPHAGKHTRFFPLYWTSQARFLPILRVLNRSFHGNLHA